MNPWFEQRWRDAHNSLLIYLRDALQERLPPDLVARTEEEETVDLGIGHQPVTYRPDVAVSEPSVLKDSAIAAVAPPSPPSLSATEPILVFLDEEVERWLEIRDTTDRLFTALELLRASNKMPGEDRERYLRKRRCLLEGGANLVEIDLVRKGSAVFLRPVQGVLDQAGACYSVGVSRITNAKEQEVYPIRLRDRLPVIRVPLRPTDADVTADLQPLIDQCHERGRYHLLDYRLPLDPPLSREDAAWADQLLREHQLR
jgi:hypothetical protein